MHFQFICGRYAYHWNICGIMYGWRDLFWISYKKILQSYVLSHIEPQNKKEDKDTPLGCEHENLVEEQDTIVSLHEDDEDEIPRYDVISYLWKYHISLQPIEIPSTSYHGSDFAKDSKCNVPILNNCIVGQFHQSY